jgi:hypothetical protein
MAGMILLFLLSSCAIYRRAEMAAQSDAQAYARHGITISHTWRW